MIAASDTPDPARRLEIARAWARALHLTAYAPMSGGELERYLLELVNRLLDALSDDPFSARPAAEVGARLVTAHFTGPDSLPTTVEVLAKALLLDPRGQLDRQRAERLVDLLGALAGGYAGAARLHTLDQQEQLSHALLAANRRVEAKLLATESRFREVFTSSTVGIAITDLDGVFVETNRALAEILACRPEQLAGRRWADFLAESYDRERLRGRRELVRADGETAWVYLARSVLRDGSEYEVTMVQDLSELQLLADRLGHQLLHDALTGLANRQLFGSRLESTVGQAPPDASITLCYLGLDALSAVNSGHGHEVGDRLLQTVAKRLEAVVAHERTLVARVGGDEFAILIEDAVDAPDIPTLVDRINADLGEPTYVDGRGIAVGASIGVVRQAAGAMSSRELFRAAEAAMRSAKATGKRQWVRFDPEHAAAVRQLDRLATELPAAWENGELGLGYLPVVRLDNRHVVGFRAVPCWSRSPGPDSCLRLAERVGLSALLTPWFLGQLCEQSPVVESLVSGSPGPLHRISLSRLQCGDADLVAAVSRALGATGISPRLLEIAFDTGALLDEAGDALDNLQVLADIGVTTALHSFTGGMRELVLLESAPVRSVILANLSTDAGPLSTVATARLIADLSQAGVRTRVDGVADTAAARHWADLGVWTASGSLFGEPATLDELVEQDGGAPTDPPAPH